MRRTVGQLVKEAGITNVEPNAAIGSGIHVSHGAQGRSPWSMNAAKKLRL
jgi:hypothetical protein